MDVGPAVLAKAVCGDSNSADGELNGRVVSGLKGGAVDSVQSHDCLVNPVSDLVPAAAHIVVNAVVNANIQTAVIVSSVARVLLGYFM